MKIVVFGATGGTGKNVVTEALKAGHDVVAVARDPAKVTVKHDKLRAVKGDAQDAASVVAAVANADAVIIAIGPKDAKNPGTVISDGVKHVVASAPKTARVVFESGLMLSDGSELSFVSGIGVAVFRMMNKKLHDDKVIAEQALTSSAFDWVIVRPPALTHTPAVGTYVVGPRARVNATRSLSHEDCAAFLVRATHEPQWVKQILNIGH